MKYSIFPPEEIIEDAVVTLPASKSISTRALVLNALTQGCAPEDAGLTACCDDTGVIASALEKAGCDKSGTVTEIDVRDSGAALRFLTALFASRPGCRVVITGSERLKQRPMAPLVDALRECGADIEYTGAEGFAPLEIRGKELSGGEITIDATVSSQFISALLMVAPLMRGGLKLHFAGEPVSFPYVLMTLGMMAQRGILADREPLCVTVAPGNYTPFRQPSEGDWSAAAFWYEISALSAGWITITNLTENTMQGDRAAAKFFQCLGVDTAPSEDMPGALSLNPSPEVFGRLDLDLTDNPDLAPALAVTCCLIGVPFRFTGLKNLGLKESDRLEAICTEMDKIGRTVEKIRDFGLEWDGKTHPVTTMPQLSAHNDHRIAMALAPVSIFAPGITLDGVECVSKSYPEYWDQLRLAGFTLIETEETE